MPVLKPLLVLIALGSTLAAASGGWDYANRYALGADYYALTYHPGGGGAKYPRELDDSAYWVVQVGAEGYADYFARPWLIIRAAGAAYKDCADVWAGFIHLGFRLNWAPVERAAFRIGIGPSFLWRESWLGVVERYRADAFFGRPKPTDKWQTAWIWYGGNLEAEYKFGRRLGLLYSLVPGYPLVITSSLGLRASF
jgi:hypothetical protein